MPEKKIEHPYSFVDSELRIKFGNYMLTSYEDPNTNTKLKLQLHMHITLQGCIRCFWNIEHLGKK